jgi:apolipoprotein L
MGGRFEALVTSRKEVIKKMKELRDDIQEEDRRQNIGKIAYSSTGIIAGGLTITGIALAPFTFVASLGLTIAGAATGAASGIAGISHGIAAHVSSINLLHGRLVVLYSGEAPCL